MLSEQQPLEFVSEGLYADAVSVEGIVDQAPIIVVARFAGETERLSLDTDNPAARREDVSWTEFLDRRFEVRQVLRGDLPGGTVEMSWPARSSHPSEGVRTEFDFTPASLTKGADYLVFLSPGRDYRGQPLHVPGASPGIARIRPDGGLEVLLARGYLDRIRDRLPALARGEMPAG